MKRKGLYIFILFLLAVFTGCQRREIVYEEEGIVGSEDSATDKKNGGTLIDSLGIGDESIWEENIQVKDAVIVIKAQVSVPEVSDLYTLEVSQYYYTGGDKRRIAECFLDKDSIKVDTEKVPTKESISKDIKTCDALLELKANDASSDEAYIAAVQSEQKRLENLLDKAPDASSITEDVGVVYTQDYYRGARDGIGYSLEFNIDKDKNVSSWILRAEDGDSFTVTEEKWQGYLAFSPESSPGAAMENLCDREKAVKQAEEICDKLGLSMDIAYIEDVYWGLEGNAKECNGYSIVFSRQLKGVLLDSNIYTRADRSDVYLDTEIAKQAYNKERLKIILNDKGIFSVEYDGILSEGNMSGPVKLLSYDQVKETFRQELKKLEVGVLDITFLNLELNYVRISNPEKRDTYTYVPAWRLVRWNGFGKQTVSNNIWINAIDGSRIDLEEEGAIAYSTLNIREESRWLEE